MKVELTAQDIVSVAYDTDFVNLVENYSITANDANFMDQLACAWLREKMEIAFALNCEQVQSDLPEDQECQYEDEIAMEWQGMNEKETQQVNDAFWSDFHSFYGFQGVTMRVEACDIENSHNEDIG